MPTPTRRNVWEAEAADGTIGVSDKVTAPGNSSREAPPRTSGIEEACDKRSGRPASRSNQLWARHGGVNLQPEVVPHPTERPPRDIAGSVAPPVEWVVEVNIQADGGRDIGFEEFLIVQRGRRG